MSEALYRTCANCWFRACEEGSVYPPFAGCPCCESGHYAAERAEAAEAAEAEMPDWGLSNRTRRWPQSGP
jgi:hypothetical protein